MSENEGSELQALTTTLRTEAFALGITGETVARMSHSPERALACVQEAVRRGGGPGLAVHIFDAGDWPREPKSSSTNLHAPAGECQTCGGDRFVLVARRPVVQSIWMREHGITPPADSAIEEMAACPDCSSAETGFTRFDGSKARALDPARIRMMLKQ